MSPNLDSVLNVTLDRTPQEWIVGIVIALFLALGAGRAEHGVSPLGESQG